MGPGHADGDDRRFRPLDKQKDAGLQRLQLPIPAPLPFRKYEDRLPSVQLFQNRLQPFLGDPLLIDRNRVEAAQEAGEKAVLEQCLASQETDVTWRRYAYDDWVQEA